MHNDQIKKLEELCFKKVLGNLQQIDTLPTVEKIEELLNIDPISDRGMKLFEILNNPSETIIYIPIDERTELIDTKKFYRKMCFDNTADSKLNNEKLALKYGKIVCWNILKTLS